MEYKPVIENQEQNVRQNRANLEDLDGQYIEKLEELNEIEEKVEILKAQEEKDQINQHIGKHGLEEEWDNLYQQGIEISLKLKVKYQELIGRQKQKEGVELETDKLNDHLFEIEEQLIKKKANLKNVKSSIREKRVRLEIKRQKTIQSMITTPNTRSFNFTHTTDYPSPESLLGGLKRNQTQKLAIKQSEVTESNSVLRPSEILVTEENRSRNIRKLSKLEPSSTCCGNSCLIF